jgi:hypothetical protein
MENSRMEKPVVLKRIRKFEKDMVEKRQEAISKTFSN